MVYRFDGICQPSIVSDFHHRPSVAQVSNRAENNRLLIIETTASSRPDEIGEELIIRFNKPSFQNLAHVMFNQSQSWNVGSRVIKKW